MIIKGLQKTTLLDFPGKVACTVFTGGCNLRCPFCHNASLVVGVTNDDLISEEEFFSFLYKRTSILDGVCITGGEPLLQKDLFDFIKRIKEMGFAVKLDTNGTYPDRLLSIIESGLIDYVAMDIKNSTDKYSLTCGTHVDTDDILRSISILRASAIDYEFRTTVVKELHDPKDIEAIAKLLDFNPKYYLQSFKDSGDIISEGLSAYSEEEMRAILSVARKHNPLTELRGI